MATTINLRLKMARPHKPFPVIPLVSYSAARDAGATLYFTGKPCPHGHIRPTYVQSRRCMECVREYNRVKAANKSKRRRQARALPPRMGPANVFALWPPRPDKVIIRQINVELAP